MILRILINFYCGLVLSVIIIISSERGMKGSTLKTSLKAFYCLNMMSSKNKIKDKLLKFPYIVFEEPYEDATVDSLYLELARDQQICSR